MKVLIIGNQARTMALFWGTFIKALAAQGHEVLLAVPDGAPLKDLQALSALVPHMEILTYPLERRSLRPWSEWQSISVLWQLLRQEMPDKVFAFTIKSIIYSALALRLGMPSYTRDGRRKIRLKKIGFYPCITGLGYAFEPSRNALLRFGAKTLYTYALRRAQRIFFQNPEDKKYFLEQGMVSARAQEKCLLCQGTGVSVRHFAYTPTYPSQPTFLLMARLLQSKGLQDFVLAARILKGNYPEARFQILGPPEESLGEGAGAIALEQVQAWQDEGSIEYLGYKADVRPCIAAASVMVLPSWREGMPCAVLEGMSMGRAAVVSDVAGNRQAVKAGENGFVVPVKDPAALAEALERFIVAPQLIVHMGTKGRRRAEKFFDAEQVAQFLLRHMEL